MTSEQQAQKTIQTQYSNHINDKLLIDMLLRALQEMQHNSNITTVVHAATTQNVQSLAESRFIQTNKKNTFPDRSSNAYTCKEITFC